jgi:hypothetical protein
VSLVVKSGNVHRLFAGTKLTWRLHVLVAVSTLIIVAWMLARRPAEANPYRAASTQQLVTTVHVGQGTGRGAVRPSPKESSPSAPVSLEACNAIAQRLDGAIPFAMHRVVHAPYVIAGNMPEVELDGWYHRVIAPATSYLYRNYDQPFPDRPICILLFREEESYRAAVQSLLGTQQVSIYGFYHPRHRTLLVNLEGGAGTLLHELTHAVIGENYPKIPLWLNEGIASLYESCELLIESDSVLIHPTENWRRRLVDEHLAAGTLPSIQSLYFTSRFQGDDEALDYALARYWCFYLSEHGRLREMFRQMRSAADIDPRGDVTLRAQTGGQSWQEIDAEFQSWLKQKNSRNAIVDTNMTGSSRYDR